MVCGIIKSGGGLSVERKSGSVKIPVVSWSLPSPACPYAEHRRVVVVENVGGGCDPRVGSGPALEFPDGESQGEAGIGAAGGQQTVE